MVVLGIGTTPEFTPFQGTSLAPPLDPWNYKLLLVDIIPIKGRILSTLNCNFKRKLL